MQRTDGVDRPLDDLRLTLTDGRQVAVATYGAPGGVDVVYLHGCPGSRLEPVVFDLHEHAGAAGVRLIAPDRPGVGGSDPDPTRSVQSYAHDVLELLDQLSVRTASLVAYADAAPYALATAALLGRRIRTTALVSCTASVLAPTDGIVPCRDWSFPRLADERLRVGDRIRWAWSQLAVRYAPGSFARHLWAALPEIDAEVLDTPSVRPQFARSLREAFRQGWSELAFDQLLTSSRSDVDLALVSGRVTLWQGTLDPSGTATALAVRDLVVRSEAHLLPEGRISLMRHHGGEILADIVRSATATGDPDDVHR